MNSSLRRFGNFDTVIKQATEGPAGDGNLLIAGDVIPNDVVSFENLRWHFGFDTEPEIALANRAALLDKAATKKLRMLGYHWTYPGVGYVERKGSAYRFLPA